MKMKMKYKFTILLCLLILLLNINSFALNNGGGNTTVLNIDGFNLPNSSAENANVTMTSMEDGTPNIVIKPGSNKITYLFYLQGEMNVIFPRLISTKYFIYI